MAEDYKSTTIRLEAPDGTELLCRVGVLPPRLGTGDKYYSIMLFVNERPSGSWEKATQELADSCYNRVCTELRMKRVHFFVDEWGLKLRHDG